MVTIAADASNSIDDVDGVYGRFFADHGIEAYIERPDFHLFGGAAMTDLPSLVDQLKTALRATTAARLQGAVQ